mgnify:CR=1 FL=1
MRTTLPFLLLMLLGSAGVLAQSVEVDSLGFETFSMTEGDTTYIMKKYHIVFLKKGENRSQESGDMAEIQRQHQAHIQWMADEGYIDMAGPFGDDGDIRGILIMRVPTTERALELAEMDPAVKAGRLSVEVHPWWAAKGSSLK